MVLPFIYQDCVLLQAYHWVPVKAHQHHIENDAKLSKKNKTVSIIVQGGVVLTIQVILLVALSDSSIHVYAAKNIL